MELDVNPTGSFNIHCVVNGPIQTNTYFVVSGTEAVMIDPAWEGEKLAVAFEEQCPGVALKAIVCTHAHADHIGGVAGVRRAFGRDVPFLISKVDAEIIPDTIRSMYEGWGYEHEMPPAPDCLLVEGDTISFGDVTLQVLETPGHTPGGIVLFAAAQTGNVAFVGDTLFPQGHGRTDLEGGDEAAIIHSLGKLGALLPPDTLCLIGHNDPTTISEELEVNFFMRRGLRRLRKQGELL